MQTLTMQGIAELAQVRRPVVSMWRARYASSERPFPEPESDDPLLFDAVEVAEWLTSTGRGNNPEAGSESPLHSSALRRIAESPDGASVLLLAHELLGEPLTRSDPGAVAQRVDAHRLGSILDGATVRAALADEPLCAAVDELAEAAYSGERALARLVDSFTSAGAPWAGEALTAPATELLGRVLAELHRSSPGTIVPAGPGGLLLAGALTRQLSEHERPTLAARAATLATSADLAAWRHLAALGFPVVPHEADPVGTADPRGRLHLLMWQGTPRLRDLAGQIEELLVELAADDLLVVVGPARLLTDREGRRERARMLTPSAGRVEPLRYVARLPKGLGRFGGRRRLALWVLGRPASRWTVVGVHGDARLDTADRSAIAADVAASIGELSDVRAHAFHTSSVRETTRFVRQGELTAAAGPGTPAPPGGERLARIWGLCDELPDDPLADVVLEAAAPPRRHVVTLAEATPGLALDLPGARIVAELLTAPAPGSAHVIGSDEVRDPATIGRRGIDRLALERAAPRARLTEPGDVVYVAAGGPAAMVDEHGGHVVLAPARVLRCRGEVRGPRRLAPPVVAADIAGQPGTDRRAWQLRIVHAEQADPLAALTARLAERRRKLLRELCTLDDLERELVGGIADGSLTVPLPPSIPSPTPKAAR